MEGVWLLLGVGLLGVTLVDVFLTALNFDEAGFLAGRITRLQWDLVRRLTRRLPRRWRPVALRQVTGLQIIAAIIGWLLGIIVGFGLIYYALMARETSFSVSGKGAGLTLFDGLYFSAAQLATVGDSALRAETDPLRFLSIVESLCGVIFISLTLTFLLGVYSVISDLSDLCRHFFVAGRGASTPTATLAPYFRDGEPNGLDGHLDGIAGSFSSYVDGVRLNHTAYYFQSGRDQFSLPYAVRMLGGTIEALRWGLPTGHPASTAATLTPLTFQFLEFGSYLERIVPWQRVSVPEVVDREEFRRLAASPPVGLDAEPQDAWVARFVQIDAAMARVAQFEPLADLDDAHRRYSQWLPFAYRAQVISLSISKDLDYQPVTTTEGFFSLSGGEEGLGLPAGSSAPGGSGLGRAVRRWLPTRRAVADRLSRSDPGYARLRVAARTFLTAAATVVTTAIVLDALGHEVAVPAVFGGLVATYLIGPSASAVGGRAWTGLVALVAMGTVVLVGAIASVSGVASGALIVLIAAVSVWIGRFGHRWTSLGRSTFMTAYFAVILGAEPSDLPYYVLAVLIAVVWAFVFIYVVLPDRPRAVVRTGIADFYGAIGGALDVLVDAVSWARWDPDIRHRVEVAMRQLHRHATFLETQLTLPASRTGVPTERAVALRLRLFDIELAATALAGSVHEVTGTTVPIDVRVRLAGRLEALRAHLTPPGAGGGERAADPWPRPEAPPSWSRPARSVCRTADELYRVAASLRREVDTPQPVRPAPAEPERPPTPVTGASGAASSGTHPATRRAVQAAVATAVGWGIGEALSSTHHSWAMLSAYLVLGETDGETLVNGARRVVGTVAGAIVGFAIVLSDAASLPVVLVVLSIAVFASSYYRTVARGTTTFWVTLQFAMLYEYLGRLTTVALELRILETLLGALAALVVAFLVLPTHVRSAMADQLAALTKDSEVIVTATLDRLAGVPSASDEVVRKRILQAHQHVNRVAATSVPLRTALGGPDAGDLDDQLTGAWALAHQVRVLVRAAEQLERAGAPVDGVDWSGLVQATRTNAEAVQTALHGELPTDVETSPGRFDLDVANAAPALAQVLRQVDRINQTLLVMLDNASPGAEGAIQESGEQST